MAVGTCIAAILVRKLRKKQRQWKLWRIESNLVSEVFDVGVIDRYSEFLLVFLAVLFVAVCRGRCDLLM